MKTVIIDYGAGNMRSVVYALNRLQVTPIISSNFDEIKSADKVIFPGVGEAAFAMQKLKKQSLDKLIPELKNPVLGICLGMQLMCNKTEEGNTKGLGIFNTTVIEFKTKLNVPQMGWNNVDSNSNLLNDISENSDFYFVHSYYAETCENTSGVTTYDKDFSSVLEKDNFYGVQFHPEKSSKQGSQLIKNFIEL